MNRTPHKFWAVNKTEYGYAEIYIYGYIGKGWDESDVTSHAFVKELNDLAKKYDTIKVRVNSPGGSITEGIAIFNAIRLCKANTEGYIDGIAASMAYPAVVACDQVYMSKYAKVMTHPSSGGCYGSIEDFKSAIALMEDLEGDILDIIGERTGLSIEDAREKYFTKGDRWINAAEAEKENLIDGIYDGEKVSIPQNATVPQMFAVYNSVLNPGAQQNQQNQNTKDMKVDMTLSTEQRAALGLADNSTPEQVNASVGEAIANKQKVTDLTNKVNDLQSKVEDYETKDETARKERISNKLDQAVTDGKITNKQKDVMADQYADDEEGLDKFLNATETSGSVGEQINKTKQKGDADLKAEYEQLDREGKLEDVAKNDWARYELMYKAKYGKAPNPDSNPNK